MSESQAVAEGTLEPHDEEILQFWLRARPATERGRVPVISGGLPHDTLPPPAWAFGATAEQADELLALVLSGVKTATASALWDYEAEGEEAPSVGDLSIVLDGQGHPRALLQTTTVRVVPFDEVDAHHAAAEGEGDRTLASWRAGHERFFTEHASHDRGFSPTMPVVLEGFELLYEE